MCERMSQRSILNGFRKYHVVYTCSFKGKKYNPTRFLCFVLRSIYLSVLLNSTQNRVIWMFSPLVGILIHMGVFPDASR